MRGKKNADVLLCLLQDLPEVSAWTPFTNLPVSDLPELPETRSGHWAAILLQRVLLLLKLPLALLQVMFVVVQNSFVLIYNAIAV